MCLLPVCLIKEFFNCNVSFPCKHPVSYIPGIHTPKHPVSYIPGIHTPLFLHYCSFISSSHDKKRSREPSHETLLTIKCSVIFLRTCHVVNLAGTTQKNQITVNIKLVYW